MNSPAKLKKVKVPFSSLTPAQQRVAIAKDAIKQLKTKKYVSESGFNYIKFLDRAPHRFNQNTIKSRKTPVCQVCQVGMALVSAVRLGNTTDIETDYLGRVERSKVRDEIARWFSIEQVVMMEAAFEQKREPALLHGTGLNTNLTKSVAFGKAHSTDLLRSIAIFTNIVTNKGEFIP